MNICITLFEGRQINVCVCVGGIIFFWIESNDRTLITPSNKKEKIEDYKKNPLPLKKGVGRRGFSKQTWTQHLFISSLILGECSNCCQHDCTLFKVVSLCKKRIKRGSTTHCKRSARIRVHNADSSMLKERDPTQFEWPNLFAFLDADKENKGNITNKQKKNPFQHVKDWRPKRKKLWMIS